MASDGLAYGQQRGDDITAPDWVQIIIHLDGDGPWCSIQSALPYLPVRATRAYAMCVRYLRRVAKEHHGAPQMGDVTQLEARADELPCVREGRRLQLSKWLLIRKYRVHMGGK